MQYLRRLVNLELFLWWILKRNTNGEFGITAASYFIVREFLTWQPVQYRLPYTSSHKYGFTILRYVSVLSSSTTSQWFSPLLEKRIKKQFRIGRIHGRNAIWQGIRCTGITYHSIQKCSKGCIDKIERGRWRSTVLQKFVNDSATIRSVAFRYTPKVRYDRSPPYGIRHAKTIIT